MLWRSLAAILLLTSTTSAVEIKVSAGQTLDRLDVTWPHNLRMYGGHITQPNNIGGTALMGGGEVDNILNRH